MKKETFFVADNTFDSTCAAIYQYFSHRYYSSYVKRIKMCGEFAYVLNLFSIPEKNIFFIGEKVSNKELTEAEEKAIYSAILPFFNNEFLHKDECILLKNLKPLTEFGETSVLDCGPMIITSYGEHPIRRSFWKTHMLEKEYIEAFKKKRKAEKKENLLKKFPWLKRLGSVFSYK